MTCDNCAGHCPSSPCLGELVRSIFDGHLDQCDAEIITRVGYLIMDIGLQRLPPALQAPAIGAIHCCLDERCDAHADGGMMSFRHA